MLRRETIGTRTDVFLLRDFLSPSECAEWIARSEDAGYGEAKVDTAAGQAVVKSVRNNDRVIRDDDAIASAWWERARQLLPSSFGRWQAIGFNERFRFYRYRPGQRFASHRDGSFERGAGEQSWLTFMVYLNEGYDGGCTKFDLAGEPEPTVIEPRAGSALVFLHDRLHTGEEVRVGTKYVLRTDVMYRRA